MPENKVLQRNPGDPVAWHHLVQATQLVNGGVAEDWTGVTVMSQTVIIGDRSIIPPIL